MTSNIHIYWDGPFMIDEQIMIRQRLEAAVMEGELSVCPCSILLLMISRGDIRGSFSVHLACGCGAQSDESLFPLSAKTHATKDAAKEAA